MSDLFVSVNGEDEIYDLAEIDSDVVIGNLLGDIKKLQAENAELKKQSQWISVEDELPELNKTVMIDSGSGFDFARFNGDYWTRKAWPLGCATKYWTPLPTPPEGE